MTLIAALLGIAADRLLTHLHRYRHYDHFLRYADWVRERLRAPAWDGMAGLLVVLLPVWGGMALLQDWTSDWLFGLGGLLFYIAVFVYCLGPRDLAVDVDNFCEVCESADPGLRGRAAASLLSAEELPDDRNECAQKVTDAVLTDANDRLFAVLFWFVLLGPLGAVLYRSTAVLYRHYPRQGGFAASLAWLYGVLVWAPARLLALSYALSGHFDAALEGWHRAHAEHPAGVEGSGRVLAATGRGALGVEEDETTPAPVRAAMQLVWRALTVWLVVISLFTLAGWAA